MLLKSFDIDFHSLNVTRMKIQFGIKYITSYELVGKNREKSKNLFSYSHLAYISRKSSKAQNEVATSVYILEVSGGLTISRIVGVYQNAGGIFIFVEKKHCYTTSSAL